MDLFLWKLLPQLIYPLAFCLWLAIISGLLIFWRKKLAVALLFVSVGILWVSSMPAFSSYLIASLERSFLPVPVAESPSADAIVILGGCVGAADYPRVDVDLIEDADWVLHATRLYRNGKAPIVIATGGTIKWLGSKTPEADSISRLLQERGVPAHAIILEPGSLNTYQKKLGCGFPEKIYQRAIEIELKTENIPYEIEKEFEVRYDGEKIGRFRLDLVIDGKVIVELKAVERLPQVFREQLISQLKASHYEVGLLVYPVGCLLSNGVNFGTPKLEYIRIARRKSV